VIRGGFNLSSVEVENALQGHTEVIDMAVIPEPDEILVERACVCVVPKDPNILPASMKLLYLREIGMNVYKPQEIQTHS